MATDRGAVAAPVVVAATGPWSAPLFAGVGFDLPVEGEYHEVAILKNPAGFRGAGPACIDGITSAQQDPRDQEAAEHEEQANAEKAPLKRPQKPREQLLVEQVVYEHSAPLAPGVHPTVA